MTDNELREHVDYFTGACALVKSIAFDADNPERPKAIDLIQRMNEMAKTFLSGYSGDRQMVEEGPREDPGAHGG